MPVVWDDAAWGSPATTCLPELWAARSICFNCAFSFPGIQCSFIRIYRTPNGFSSSLCCFFLPPVSPPPGSRCCHESWQQLPYNGDFCPDSAASPDLTGAAGRLHSMRLSRCCRQYIPALGGKLSATYLPSFAQQTGNISSSAVNSMCHAYHYLCKGFCQSHGWIFFFSASSTRAKMWQSWVYFFSVMSLKKLFFFFFFPDSESASGK